MSLDLLTLWVVLILSFLFFLPSAQDSTDLFQSVIAVVDDAICKDFSLPTLTLEWRVEGLRAFVVFKPEISNDLGSPVSQYASKPI